MAKYVQLPKSVFEDLAKHYKLTSSEIGRELVLVRVHSKNPNVRFFLYTSCSVDDDAVRSKGTDAIRVAVTHINPKNHEECSWLYYRRINRAGTVDSVVNRIKVSMDEAAAITGAMFQHVCPRCGAPTYTNSGRCVVTACRYLESKERVVMDEERIHELEVEEEGRLYVQEMALDSAVRGRF